MNEAGQQSYRSRLCAAPPGHPFSDLRLESLDAPVLAPRGLQGPRGWLSRCQGPAAVAPSSAGTGHVGGLIEFHQRRRVLMSDHAPGAPGQTRERFAT